MKFRVCDLKHKDIERIRNARAVWGHEKYGDRDKDRDHCLDMLEEVMDIENILNRTMFWLGKEEKKQYTVYEFYYLITNQCKMLSETIVEFDQFLRNKGIEINDNNGGDRIGIK